MKSWSAGIRHSLSASAAITFEWNHFTDFEGAGDFPDALEDGETELDSADLYTLSVDAVF